MPTESNQKCPKCGEEMFQTEPGVLKHTYFICPNCHYMLAIRGQKHYFHIDEIDLQTGKITPFKERGGVV